MMAASRISTALQTEPPPSLSNFSAALGSWVGDLRALRFWRADAAGNSPERGETLREFLRQLRRGDAGSVRTAIRAALREPGLYSHLHSTYPGLRGEASCVTLTRVFRNASGVPICIGAVTVCSDDAAESAIRDNLHLSQDGLDAVLRFANVGAAIFDGEGGLLRWNSRFAEAMGWPSVCLRVGLRNALLFLPLVVCADLAGDHAMADVARLLARLRQGERVRLNRCGAVAPIELWAENLAEGHLAVFAADAGLSGDERARLTLAEAVLAHSHSGIVFADADGRVLHGNAALMLTTGYAAEEIRGKPLAHFVAADSSDGFARLMTSLDQRGVWHGEMPLLRKNQESYDALINALRVDHEEPCGDTRYIWILSDVSAGKRAAEQMYHLAHHDVLTGLANRTALQLRLVQAVSEAKRRNGGIALLFIDLDRFKIINDTLGHAIGDRLLGEVAARLQRIVRESDLIARLGGDEFVILLSDIDNANAAAAVAAKVLAAFASPVVIDANELHTSPSIGISLFPSDGTDSETLLRNADTAMYHAKANGRNNYQFFAAEMNRAANQRLDLERKLRQALAHGELSVAFQPQLRAGDHMPVGVEALARWRHPVDGVIPPALFIPVAEETGLIVELGEWVLRHACRTMREWIDAGLPPLKVAVNVSARQLRRRDFLETVAGILAETELPPELLELEVTESVAMENPEQSIGLLRAIRQMGVSIAIDDFGTGYSSLAYLKLLPIDFLKIDRSFVADIEIDLNDRAIAFGTIALAHSLGLGVIAEGVETADQLDLLRSNGCDQIQGYFFSPPLAADEAAGFLRRQLATGRLPER